MLALAILRRRAAALLAAALLFPAAPLAALAGQDTIPVPTVTIYPGDIIRDSMLTERDMPPDFAGSRTTVLDRSALVGKTARRTLLPGLPVALNTIAEPKVVTIGSMVRVVFAEGGLTITTYASALQAGAVGDVIPVRNMETGLTVSGTIEGDGSIKVNNG